MSTRLGFLRAINLGATRRFAKADIVRAVEAAGFTDVATHINTGNVRFATTLRSRARIEAALEASFAAVAGFDVPTVTFTQQELAAIAAEADSFGHTGKHYVSLLKAAPTDAAVAALQAQVATYGTGEVARVGGRGVHLLLGENYHEAKLTNVVIERHLGVATNRNATVVRTLAEKWC